MKKESMIIFLIVAGLLFIPAIQAQPNIPVTDADNDGIPDQISEKNLQNISNQTLSKLDYLSQEWKALLLQNSFIAKADSLFRQGNIVFFILFSENYDLSFSLFFIMILWIIFLIKIAEVAKKGFGMTALYSTLIGLAGVLLFSHIRLFRAVVDLLITFIFAPEAKWARALIGGAVIFMVILFYTISTIISKKLEVKRKKDQEKQTELNQKKLERLTEAAGIGKGEIKS